VEAVRKEEVKLWGIGFVKEVGFQVGGRFKAVKAP